MQWQLSQAHLTGWAMAYLGSAGRRNFAPRNTFMIVGKRACRYRTYFARCRRRDAIIPVVGGERLFPPAESVYGAVK